MTGGIRTYRFKRSAQWEQCLLHGFDVSSSGVALSARFTPHATQIGSAANVTAVASVGDQSPTWRIETAAGRVYLVRLSEVDSTEVRAEVDAALARATRWVMDRHSLWSAIAGESVVGRYDLQTLDQDVSRDLGAPVLDIATDAREGLWVLVDAGGAGRTLRHLDCEGRPVRTLAVPVAACRPTQIAGLDRGNTVAILAAEGRRLVILDTRNHDVHRVLEMNNIAEGLTVQRIAADGRNRIALWGKTALRPSPALFVLDAHGDSLDGPIDPRFGGQRHAANAPVVADLAISRTAVWLGTSRGLWTLTADAPGAAGADGTLLTRALVSPESYTDRGWLRAELDIDLPRGAVVEASFASTKHEAVAAQLTAIANDSSASIEQRQQQIWSLLEHPAGRTFTVTGPSRRGVPDASIDRYIPATFRGSENDPEGVLRRLVGVLESTTQRIDQRIASIGQHLQADTAPDAWLDYIARWFDLPWDDGLNEQAKRAILRQANGILEHRGTRHGLALLLDALLGTAGAARVSDVTVDHPVNPIGGDGRPGPALPVILAGASTHIATLGVKAVLGRSRIACGRDDINPLHAIVPTVTIRIAARRATIAALKPVVPGILAQYIPAGLVMRLRWQSAPFGDALDDDGIELDATGTGRLGDTSSIGRTILGGRLARRLTDPGVDIDLRLT
jgi:phage tail-like protein